MNLGKVIETALIWGAMPIAALLVVGGLINSPGTTIGIIALAIASPYIVGFIYAVVVDAGPRSDREAARKRQDAEAARRHVYEAFRPETPADVKPPARRAHNGRITGP